MGRPSRARGAVGVTRWRCSCCARASGAARSLPLRLLLPLHGLAAAGGTEDRGSSRHAHNEQDRRRAEEWHGVHTLVRTRTSLTGRRPRRGRLRRLRPGRAARRRLRTWQHGPAAASRRLSPQVSCCRFN